MRDETLHELHDPALSASTSLTSDALSARPRADLKREVRPLLWRERAPTIVC
jgi:hypothetical protein